MGKYRVESVEERADGDVACDTFVLKDDDTVIGHFTVILDAAAVLAGAELTQTERIALYKMLFSADPRIQGVTDSEAAVTQMEADVNFPVTVTIGEEEALSLGTRLRAAVGLRA